MNNVPPTRINMVEKIETALKLLTSQGYDVQSAWSEHNTWLQTHGVPLPDLVDETWARNIGPERLSSMDDHFTGTFGFETLNAWTVSQGRQYTLTPGQREYLRERYGLTPTAQVYVDNVGFFKGSSLIYSLTLRSTEHIDPSRRRVLNAAVLAPASHFFRDSAMLDKAREDEKVSADAEAAKKTGKAPKLPSNIALQYLV